MAETPSKEAEAEGKVLETPKAKGAYTLIEETRESAPAEAVERAVAIDSEAAKVISGEEVVDRIVAVDPDAARVIDGNEVTERVVAVDSDAMKVIAGAEAEEHVIMALDDETKTIPAAAVEEKPALVTTTGYILTENTNEAKKIEGTPLKAPKAKGAYTIIEQPRDAAPTEEVAVEDEILHVGEEIVTVIDDETTTDEFAVLSSDSDAVAEKTAEKTSVSNTIMVSGDGRGYIVTEMPDSAKRFEATEATEIKKSSYTITVAPDQAKKIEGRPEISYTVNVDEDGKKTVIATPSKDVVSAPVKYGVVESSEDARVISARDEKPEIIVSPEDAKTIEAADAEHIVTVVEDMPVAEAPVEAAPEKKEYTGYILTENSNETKVISAKEAKGGYIVTEQPDSAKRFAAAPDAEIVKENYTIVVSNEQAKKIEGRPEVQYSINIDEKGRRILNAAPAAEVVQEKEAPVFEAYENAVEEIFDNNGEIVTVIHDELPESYAVLDAISDTPVEPEKTEKAHIEDTIVVNEPKPIIFEDNEGARVVAGKKTEESKAPVAPDYIIVEEGGAPAEERKAKPVITEDKSSAKVIAGDKAEAEDRVAPDYILIEDGGAPAEDHKAESLVFEDVEATKTIEPVKILNAPKSRDAYVIAEKVDSAKVVGAKDAEAASEHKPEILEGKAKTIAEAKKPAVAVAPEEAKQIKATNKGRYTISESPEDAKVLNKAEESEYTVIVHSEDTRTISAEKKIFESENPKTILATNKVLNTSKAQNAYAILESRDTKVISPVAAKKEETVTGRSGRYTLGISDDVKVVEGAAETAYKLGTDEEHAKVIEAIETLKRANYDVSEIERSEKTIPAAKILNTTKSKDAYIITESRDAKVIPAELSDIREEEIVLGSKKEDGYEIVEKKRPYAPAAKIINASKSKDSYVILEERGSEKVIAAELSDSNVLGRDEEIVLGAKDSGYEIVEEKIARAPVTRVINASKSKDTYAILETRGSEKVISADQVDEPIFGVTEQPGTAARIGAMKTVKKHAASGFNISERHNAARVISGVEEEIPSGFEINEQPRTEVIIPAGTKILSTPKAKERYIISERRGTEKTVYAPDPIKEVFELENSAVRVRAKAEPISLNTKSSTYRITEDQNTIRTIHRAVSEAETLARGKNYLVYEENAPHIIAQRKISKPGKPLVYEQIGSERIVGTDDFKMREKPLIYEELGTHKTILAEGGIKAKIKDNIIEYMGTEAVIRGDIPVVDVLIDPYKNQNMGVLSPKDLKKFLSENDKEIAHLKHDLKYAKKKKNSCEKAAEKIMAHIAMINYQCLICEKYVERINVCNNAEATYYAKQGAETLAKEIKTYNEYMTEYNVLTSSKVPLADKTLPKRVLAGKAYEHLTRISYNVVNEPAPIKTKKKKTKAKIIQENRYMADIKLLNRRDEETANSVSVVENRYVFETALLKGERDIMAFKFAKNSKKNAVRKAYIARKLRSLNRSKKKAIRYEALDNDRYYRVLTCDTNLESYNNNNAKKKKVTKIVSEVSNLLKERDELNSKLNAIYSGPLGNIVGASESDKWREVKVAAAKKHSRKLKGKANALKNSVPGFGEKKAERIFTFNSLLDAKVEALATIDLCKYRLRKEKNSLRESMSIRKDMAEARKTIKLINREIKERKKIIKEEHYGPDGSADITILLILCIALAAGGIFLASKMGVDIIGMVKPYIQKVIDIVKGYLM